MIKAQNIHKNYGDLEVLKGISFDVKLGETVAIIGSSGSGKSTFLRCLNRLEKVDSGTIIVDDEILCEDVNGRAVYSPQKTLNNISRKMGLVFQQFNLFPHFSVLRNVTEALVRVLMMNRKEAEQIAMSALKKTGLESKADSYPYQLSGGQQQRVAISRALALNPQYLCFDEPTSSLDPELTAEVLAVIKNLAREKTTMIIVTHEMEFAREAADKIIFMDKGIIAGEGTPHEIFDLSENPRIKQFINKFKR